jgi:glutathione S-transferase
MLTIWGRKTSSNVQALMWCVGELGLDYPGSTWGIAMAVPTARRFIAQSQSHGASAAGWR